MCNFLRKLYANLYASAYASVLIQQTASAIVELGEGVAQDVTVCAKGRWQRHVEWLTSAGKFMEQTRSCGQDGICWAAECNYMWEELQCCSLWLLKMPKDLPVAASSQGDPEGTCHTSTEPSIQLSPCKKVLAWFQIGHLAARQLMPWVQQKPLWIWSLTEKATMWTELPRTRGHHMNYEAIVSYW